MKLSLLCPWEPEDQTSHGRCSSRYVRNLMLEVFMLRQSLCKNIDYGQRGRHGILDIQCLHPCGGYSMHWRETSTEPLYPYNLPLYSLLCVVIFICTIAIAVSPAGFGQGAGPVFLRDVGCIGNESSLLSCSHSGSVHYCSHYNDAGVVCTPCKLYFAVYFLNCTH